MNRFQKILMATDFSDASAPAWRRAVELAAENRAELLVAHAYAPPQFLEMGPMPPRLYDEWDEHLCTEVGKKLQLLVNDAAKSGVKARPLVLTGDPEEALVTAATDHHVDLLVMGTHGRKGVSRFFLGSVAARVIASAPCAVLTVRLESATLAPRPVDEDALAVPIGA
ncbi:MAG: universal stress protein [Acidobacteriota bacterium]|nr:universal stress protein [Acidobacteriota bacterium]